MTQPAVDAARGAARLPKGATVKAVRKLTLPDALVTFAQLDNRKYKRPHRKTTKETPRKTLVIMAYAVFREWASYVTARHLPPEGINPETAVASRKYPGDSTKFAAIGF